MAIITLCFLKEVKLYNLFLQSTDGCARLTHHAGDLWHSYKMNEEFNAVEESVSILSCCFTMDKLVHCYTTKRKTRRWPMRIFYSMVTVNLSYLTGRGTSWTWRIYGRKHIPGRKWKTINIYSAKFSCEVHV